MYRLVRAQLAQRHLGLDGEEEQDVRQLDNARNLVHFRGRQQRRALLERPLSLRAEFQEEEGEAVRAHRCRAGAVLGTVLGPGVFPCLRTSRSRTRGRSTSHRLGYN
ncbi:hypothetical protein J4Q44_G00239560 [Coregonus suidteri]|uniref:Uncharacterized protein n=1 Tax=Coregonus suidteri TaxID=861788 RepID=A0AAN8LPA1_9TELE